MKRTLGLSLLIMASLGWVALLGQLSGGDASAEENETLRHQAELRIDGRSQFPEVLLHVLIEDQGGRPVGGLPTHDFSATEDGIAVELRQPDAGGPVRAVLVIDRSNSMSIQGKLTAAREAAEVFVRMMRDGNDVTALVLFADGVERLGPLTGDQDQLVQQIRSILLAGNTAFHDGVHAALDILEGESGRRIVVALTDGEDNSSVRGFEEVIVRAQEYGIPIHAIGLGSQVSAVELERLAAETGGQLHVRPPLASLAEIYRGLMRNVQNEHLLAYDSPTPRLDGTRRRVALTTQVADGALLLRDSYTVASLLTPGDPGPLKVFPPVLLGVLIVAPSVLRLLRRHPSGDDSTSALP